MPTLILMSVVLQAWPGLVPREVVMLRNFRGEVTCWLNAMLKEWRHLLEIQAQFGYCLHLNVTRPNDTIEPGLSALGLAGQLCWIWKVPGLSRVNIGRPPSKSGKAEQSAEAQAWGSPPWSSYTWHLRCPQRIEPSDVPRHAGNGFAQGELQKLQPG